MPILFVTIAQSGQVSGDIDMRQYALLAIRVPTITSGDLLVQGNFDTTSGTFGRLQRTQPDTGDMRFATGPGSNMILWALTAPTPAYARLEAAAPQTDVRTFSLLVR